MRRALIVAVLQAGCIASSPETEAEDALGSNEHAEDFLGDEGHVRGNGDKHRPGQPCLVCHDGEFELAGTVFARDEWAGPLHRDGDAVVCVWHEDLSDQACAGTSGGFGNFHSLTDDGGRHRIPPFPLHVLLRRDNRHGPITAVMRSVIHRERSCAGCHAIEGPLEDRVEPVLREAPPCAP